MKNIARKLLPWLTFNLGFALTGLPTARPRFDSDLTTQGLSSYRPLAFGPGGRDPGNKVADLTAFLI